MNKRTFGWIQHIYSYDPEKELQKTSINLWFKVETVAYFWNQECHSDSKFMVEKQILEVQ